MWLSDKELTWHDLACSRSWDQSPALRNIHTDGKLFKAIVHRTVSLCAHRLVVWLGVGRRWVFHRSLKAQSQMGPFYSLARVFTLRFTGEVMEHEGRRQRPEAVLPWWAWDPDGLFGVLFSFLASDSRKLNSWGLSTLSALLFCSNPVAGVGSFPRVKCFLGKSPILF